MVAEHGAYAVGSVKDTALQLASRSESTALQLASRSDSTALQPAATRQGPIGGTLNP